MSLIQEKVHEEVIHSEWTVGFARAEEYPEFQEVTKMDKLQPLSNLEDFERVSGTVSYSTNLTLNKANDIIEIELGPTFEIAEVFVNEVSAGVNIAPPYCFDVSGLFRDGENELRIEVTNTLGTEFRGGLNQYLMIEPFGLIGDIKMKKRII